MRLLIVSYRLPFRVVRGRLTPSAGGLVSSMLAYAKGKDGGASDIREVIWVGASNNTAQELASARRKPEQSRLTLIPVTIPDTLDQRFYGGFCNDLIWPLFHYFASISNFDERNWAAYEEANEIFRAAICEIAKPDDYIWVHDYHFMLLPAMLRASIPSARIGFFLHVPFPSFEVIRQMPRKWLVGLLNGMLGADLVGLHTYDYVQYFNSSVMRTLNLPNNGGLIRSSTGSTRVESFPIGIDAESFRRELSTNATGKEMARIREAIGTSTMMFSLDRMDYSKGLLKRVEAFELFLQDHPEWKEQITFNMVVIPSRGTIVRYQKLRKELEAFIGRVNGLYGTLNWRPIVYQYKTLTTAEMVALYNVAQVGLITPMRDGMNLVAKEFIACQNEDDAGVLILSEMAGASSELREATLVNPNDRREIADAIHLALQTPIAERRERWRKLHDRVFSYDVFAWAKDFLQTLDIVWKMNLARKTSSLLEGNLPSLHRAWRKGESRAIFLDHDGTLVPFYKNPEDAIPAPELLDTLRTLAADGRNQVCIISGRRREFLDKWFENTGITLVAEHGAFLRHPGKEWETVWKVSPNWSDGIRQSMNRACRRCLGSAIEEKAAAIVWHYRNAEPAQGLYAAQELQEELKGILTSDAFEVVPGNRIVEVRPRGFNKGKAARSLLRTIRPGFVMAIGDDKTDEDLFEAIPKGGYPIKVGAGETLARYHLNDHREVATLLRGLVQVDSQAN